MRKRKYKPEQGRYENNCQPLPTQDMSLQSMGYALENENDAYEYEKCAMCGTVTDVPVFLRIEARTHYVEGCGQLCEKCRMHLSHIIKDQS